MVPAPITTPLGKSREAGMGSAISSLLALALVLGAAPALAQASSTARPSQPNWWSAPGGENGPSRTVWAAQKTPETPYTGPNKPIWHIADILRAHAGRKSWDQPVLLTPDFDGHYISMAPGEKTKCMFYADDRAFGWVYSGQARITIDGHEPKILSKGWAFNVAPRLSYCMETVGNEPVVFFRTTPAGQAPSYPESETPAPVEGYTYVKARITSTGGYDSLNLPFFNVDEYGASERTGERFLYDGHTNANLHPDPNITELPPSTSLGHFHANMAEAWVDVYGQVDVLISGVGLVHGDYGDVIHANEERWHRATSRPNTGKSIRMAITSRSKEGQVLYYQADPPAKN
jgi:mannose-6-phosphate isomerase-like protein (cupin superfamily)